MEKINLVELLKDCIGMELDCSVFNHARLEKINSEEDREYPIQVNTLGGCTMSLTKYGTYINAPEAKCVIFPKGKTTWEGFVPPLPPCQFKDGDVIVDKYGAVAIYKRVHSFFEEPYVDFHCGITSKTRSFFTKDSDSLEHCGEIDTIRFASEEEKAELFDAIKANGYEWNEETKTLGKLSKFKVGDRVKKIATRKTHVIGYITESGYVFQDEGGIGFIFGDEHIYELVVPNKFDITTLKPFDKVLVRDFDNTLWEIEFFSRLLDRKHFKCLDVSYTQCIPYEGNEHLLGTNKECDEFYRTWEKTGD